MQIINTILKHKTILIFTGVIFIAGFVILILDINKEKAQDQKEKSVSPVQKRMGTIDISGLQEFPNAVDQKTQVRLAFKEALDIPETLPVYSYEPKKINELDAVKKLVNEENLSKIKDITTENSGKIEIYQNGSKTLTAYEKSSHAIYSNSDLSETNQNNFTFETNIDQYKNSVEEQLNKYLNIDNYQHTKTLFRKYPDVHAEIVNSITNAGLIEFEYEGKLNNYAIYGSNKTFKGNIKINVYIDSFFVIRKLEFTQLGNITPTDIAIPMLTNEDLHQRLLSKEAKITRYSVPIDEGIQSIIFNKKQIVYIIQNDRLVPVFLLSASIINKSDQKGTAEFILQGIKS